MTLDGDVILLEELADGEELVDNGYVYGVRVKILKLPNELIRFVEVCLSEVSIEEVSQSVGGGHGKSRGRRVCKSGLGDWIS